jgi:hypothetical protein
MTPLDDATAIQILTTIAPARLRPATPDLAPAPDIRAALAAAFDNPAPTAPSEGDLARAALDRLAQDPAFAEPIRIMSRPLPASAISTRHRRSPSPPPPCWSSRRASNSSAITPASGPSMPTRKPSATAR